MYYEQYETIIPITSFVYDEVYRKACETCPKFGKNFACPPYSPNFIEYSDTQNYAKVICIRMPIEYFNQIIVDEGWMECSGEATSVLIEELLNYRKENYLVAGSSFCVACDVCAVEEGCGNCKKPRKKIYSLESLGVNIIALAKTCFDFDLEWSFKAGFICSIGSVFLNEKPKNRLTISSSERR